MYKATPPPTMSVLVKPQDRVVRESKISSQSHVSTRHMVSFEHRATSSSKFGSMLQQLKYIIENLLPGDPGAGGVAENGANIDRAITLKVESTEFTETLKRDPQVH